MTEKLLQYIWQFRHFNSSALFDSNGDKIEILQQGTFNSNQGPDFLNARIRIKNTEWAGNIELHVCSSEWILHKHSEDPNYKNIILHVVWKIDEVPHLPFPTLEIQHHVSGILINRYDALMQNPQFIACNQMIGQVPYLHFAAWKERLLTERLQQRSQYILKLLNDNEYHWEEVFWWMLARNFGLRVNTDAFEAIAKSIPLNILAKHKSQIQQIEALLLGQAAILDKKFEETYPAMLRKEYEFLQKKYKLVKPHLPIYYLRMRPANFPTIRLAQLAMLIHKSLHLFSITKETNDVNEIIDHLKVTANDYWHYHYIPDNPLLFKKKALGMQMVHNIMINTIVPMLFAYGYYHRNSAMQEKAFRWLEQIASEQNSITRGFTSLGIPNKNAFDSQALIQLKNEYCNQKYCLKCAVGNWILKQK